MLPHWEIRAFGHEIANPFFPGVVLPGITFALLYAWPFLEQRFTNDTDPHNLLDRPRDRPLRTAFGVATITFYLVLFLAAGTDVLAATFGLSFQSLLVMFQLSLIVAPPLFGWLTWRLLKELSTQRAHPIQQPVGGRIVRTAAGGYAVVVASPMATVPTAGPTRRANPSQSPRRRQLVPRPTRRARNRSGRAPRSGPARPLTGRTQPPTQLLGPPDRSLAMLTTEWLERRLAWAVAALAASAVFMAWWLHWFDLVDLEVYRSGATAFLHGRDIYTAHPRVIPLPFTYPPFASIVFVPLGVLPDVAARVAMSLLSGAALVFAALAALRLAAPGWPARSRWTVALAIAAATPLIEPIRDTFRLGQVNLVLMALVLADLAAIVASARTGGPRLPRGVLIGLATAVKLTPGIFILYLLAVRRTREALTAMASAAAATVVAALLMPSESAHFWRHLVFDDRRIGSAGSVWNQSLRGAVARLSGSPDRGHLLWLVLALLVAVAGLALAAHLSGPGSGSGAASEAASGSGGGRPLLGLGVAALTGLLVSPISWNHHWVWFLPLAIALAAGRWRRAAASTAWSPVRGSPPSAWLRSRGGHSPAKTNTGLGRLTPSPQTATSSRALSSSALSPGPS